MPEETPQTAGAAYAETEILICLAGRRAEVLARRPGPNGWRRLRDRLEIICLHESGHAVVAAALGYFQGGIAVEETAAERRGIAKHSVVAMPPDAPDHLTFEGFEKLPRDFETAVAFAKLVIGLCGWRAYLRTLQHKVDAILTDHWLAVAVLASEVLEKRLVRRDRVEEILARWMPVKERSLAAYIEARREPPGS